MDKLNAIPETVTIQLTRGQVSVVDAVDGDLAEVKWSAVYNPHTNSYYAVHQARRSSGKHATEYLHRVILARIENRRLQRNELTDHVNRDSLNNTRTNLRLATYNQNQHNRGRQVRNTSGFKGVSWCKRTQRWRAYISHNRKFHALGYHDTAEAAARAYDRAAREFHGAFAVLNFP